MPDLSNIVTISPLTITCCSNNSIPVATGIPDLGDSSSSKELETVQGENKELMCVAIKKSIDSKSLDDHLSEWYAKNDKLGLPKSKSFLPFLVGAPKLVQFPFCYSFCYDIYHVKKKRDDTDRNTGCTDCSSSTCSEDCVCRHQSISCSKACGCSEMCTNKPFRKDKRIKIVLTKHCGWGVEAAESIKKGEFIIEYVGEVISDAMCEQRLWKMKNQGIKNFYMCEVRKNFTIDATVKGNASRFLNHSCGPNCNLEKWDVDGETRVGVFAARSIKVGEPLTYDYRAFILMAMVACLTSSTNAIAGQATFYTPPYVPSSCFGTEDRGVMILAANSGLFANRAACGTRYRVTCVSGTNAGVPRPCTGNSVDVTVVDLCPGCAGNQVDLSQEAFAVIANTDAGRINIEYNRHQSISCSKACGCSEMCTNKPFRKDKRIKIVLTKHCGWGVEAAESIKKGEFIIEYVGEVISDAMCEQRLWKMKNQGIKNFYMCEVRKNFTIDATVKGNASRFLNHSCGPNCNLEKWDVDGETRVGVFAARSIKVGEPLTYDYRFVQFGPEVKCKCGASCCQGYLGSKKKIPKLGLLDWGAKRRRTATASLTIIRP
ncbi:hypothetical protein SSX86_005115 [Deinandra increscens subsp. villosa]|uniref:Uncharacterized protein n=1 Tax=Deinandra increscens subsp. villosa TaxID=3103831 RepID=A0AAP0DKH6_9ASTR